METLETLTKVESAEEQKQVFTVGMLRDAHAVALNYQKIPSPFGWACLRSVEKIEAAIKKYDQDVTDKQRELALTYKEGEKKGCYITTGPNETLTHTAEALKKINDFATAQKEIEVEYTPYFASNFDEIKGNLKVLSLVNGIIIKKIDLEEYVNRSVIS